MSIRRSECRYERREDPRAQFYGITALGDKREETQSAKKSEEGNIGVLGGNQ